jgi:hypothetical protein
VLIGAKPWVAAVESAANVAAVAIEDYVFAIHTASELRRGNFYFGGFVPRDAGVGDCDSPQHGGFEAARGGNGIHVAGFITDLVRNAWIVRDDEGEWTRSATVSRDHCDRGGQAFVRDNGDQFLRGNDFESGVGGTQKNG